VGLAALFLAGEAIRIGLATSAEESVDLPTLHRALRLDPGNPQLHHRIGLVYSYAQEEHSPSQALRHLRRATELNPNRAIYWLSLASACDSVPGRTCAEGALEKALALNPMTPRLHWVAANRYLLADRQEAALPQFRRLLELSSNYDWAVFRLCLDAYGDPMVVLDKVIPDAPNLTTKLDYVNFLSAQGEADVAYRAWGQVVAGAAPFPLALAEPYLQRLFELGRYREAAGVWQDLERLSIVKRAASDEAGNLIFNGDFEQDVLNAGFDWRTAGGAYLGFGFPSSGAYRGKRCFRLDFGGRNEESEPLLEFVPVAPSQAYSLTAYARSEDVTSDSGPRLRVLDPACPACLDVSSETTVGTTPWHALSLRFSTGARTQVVRVSVRRPRGRSFPTEITGTFWLDAVTLKALAGEK
jgi:tetratricopeptide (TPR) repeat protein